MTALRETTRGAAATAAALVVMGLLAVCALACLHAPVNWPFAAVVLSAAFGGSASLTGSVEAGSVAANLAGTIDVMPLGITGAGALAFCVVFLRSWPGRLSALVPRAAGAAVVLAAGLAALAVAGDAAVTVPLPVGRAGGGVREALLTVRPDPTSTVLGGLVWLAVLVAVAAALSRLPYRRTVGTAVVVAPAAFVLAGLLVTVAAGIWRPAAAAAALLFGPNALLAALLTSFGAAPPTAVSPAGTTVPGAAGQAGWLLHDTAGSTAVRVAVVLAFVLLCAVALAAVPPEPGGSRRQRAGMRALVSGVALAVVLAGMATVAAGSLDLGLSVFVFQVRILSLTLPAATGWALLAGALCGGLAGFAGSLVADARRPSAEAGPGPAPVTVREHATERG
jgi:hypothetical protein